MKEVVKGRTPDTMDTLVQQTESPFTAEVLRHPLPAKFRMPQVEAFDGVPQYLQKSNGAARVSGPYAMQGFRYHTKRPSLGLVQ